MKEIISLRKPREKHFLNNDGTITLYAYDSDIHYLNNDKYEEIDNTLIETKEGYQNKKNSFKMTLYKKNDTNKILRVEQENYYLEYSMDQNNKNSTIQKIEESIFYQNIQNNIELKYVIQNNKLKDYITLKSPKSNLKDLKFKIKTNLNLNLSKEGIEVKAQNQMIYFIEKPTLMDKNNEYYPIHYQLEKIEDFYYLSFQIKDDILSKEELYPFVIDPTITNKPTGSVYDTYIYPGDENTNRNDTDILKVGVDKDNKIYRTLIKFDLPVLGTACEIIGAHVVLTSHKNDYEIKDCYYKHVNLNAHQITASWTEQSANWNNMHNQYNPKIEDYFWAYRSELYEQSITLKGSTFPITNLVKRWYSGEPNYGILLKFEKEVYDKDCKEHAFYSKNNSIATENINDPKPFLMIQYRNFNGLESYMSYQTINYQNGQSNINYLTGNLTNVFEINKTIGGQSPLTLSLIYNTNDVVLNKNYQITPGYKWNYYQTLTEEKIEDNDYLEYLDADGTIHYFRKNEEEFKDEDGLNLTVKLENSKYLMTDKNNNKFYYTKEGNQYFLTEIIDNYNNHTQIVYTNNKITKIINPQNEEISISYNENKITTISNYETTNLFINDNKLIKIENRLGVTLFDYNENNIVNKITDVNSKQMKFDYYDSLPYRMKKITEIGLNNAIGNTLEFIYGFLVTRVKDHKGRINTYTFNDQGNTTGITNLKSNDDFIDSYGIHKEFDTYNASSKNKLLLSGNVSKYTNNFFPNHSFEDPSITSYDKGIVVKENARSGDYCLKITETTKIPLPHISKEDNYTFSGYFKNSNNMNLFLIGNNNEKLKELKNIEKNEDYQRFSLTSNLNENTNYFIQIEPLSNATIYLDDIQFEKGSIANYINIIENSDFKKGFTKWERNTSDTSGNMIQNNDEIVTLPNGAKAYKRKNQSTHSTSLTQTLNYAGEKNETYKLSFWYKNEGIISDDGDYSGNLVFLNFKYKEEIPGEPFIYHLNIHATEWQYFETTFTTRAPYEKIFLEFVSQREVNDFYLTHITLTKDLEVNSFSYDERGNLKSSKDQSNGVSNFKYDNNNQVTSIFTPKGNHFAFEYDNIDTSKLLQGISSNGIANIIEYDENNNPVKSIIKKVKNPDSLDGHSFYIRKKGTKEYLFIDQINKTLKFQIPECNTDSFTLEASDKLYRIKTSLTSLYFKIIEDEKKLVLKKEESQATLFDFQQNDNGSYSLKLPNSEECLTLENSNFTLKQYDEDNINQQFYFENTEYQEYIETKMEYTSDNKYISKTIDELGHETIYNNNPVNGLLNSVEDANGIKTTYSYDNQEKLIKISKEEQEVNYVYNNQEELSEAICENKTYYFNYDEFSNMKNIKINNTNLVDYNYEANNGNLKKVTYGNNDQIDYEYDELERIKQITQNNKTYKFYYNNLNDLVKVTAPNEEYSFDYDFAHRVSKYQLNENSIEYEYDENSNITDKIYHFQDETKNIHYTYDKDDTILSLSLEDNRLNYTYDSLGRLKNKNINNQLAEEYEYYGIGDKTSNILKSIKSKNNHFKYVYDKLYNPTHIYQNNQLINHYKYNNLNELVEEENYIAKKIYKYYYDKSGNILKKQEFALEDERLLQEDIYEYQNNNWKDQLTRFNNINIFYDEIGNPIKIGNNNLTWNARELQSYEIENLNVHYSYDKDGIRTQKIVNGKIIKYFTENSSIIFEESNGNVIYYIRDDNNKLLGFTYNDETYYYQKNAQEDIIGIYNSQYNLIATYEYDAWGKIRSVKDENGQEITDNTNIALINPYRYRSYYYDEETKLYYLNARYYNPEWRRFLNPDSIIGAKDKIINYNLYNYCENNPINNLDESGQSAIAIGGAIGIGIGVSAGTKALVGIVAKVAAMVMAIFYTKTAIKAHERAIAKNKNLGNHNVYVLVDPKKKTSYGNKVEYVGRTTNLQARAAQHSRNEHKKDLVMYVVAENTTREIARGTEQGLIEYYGTLNRGEYKNNQINGVNPNRKDAYDKYKNHTIDYLGKETYVGGIEW